MTRISSLFSLDGDIAVITGAAGGLGIAQARILGLAGATIIASDVTDEAAASAVARLALDGIRATPLTVDVSDTDSINAAFDALESREIAPNILVNNAGVSVRSAAMDATPEQFDLTFGVNVRGLYFMAQRAAQMMRRGGGGRIVNLASIGGLVVDGPRSSVYDASKAAVVQATKNMANEWAKHGIRVNGIAPGYMRTAMTEELMPTKDSEADIAKAHIPLGRIGTPQDLEGALLFLTSGASSYVTGHTLPVDGGWLVSV